MTYPDPMLRDLLKSTKCIACVGVSPNPVRPSHFVGRYLSLKGYRVVPVNPGQAGKELWGQTVYASLADIPEEIPVDMVDIFRRSEFVPEIVDQAMAHLPHLRTIWMQIGVTHSAAAEKAEAAGLTVIQNLCPKMEYQRLFGELRMAGINTRIISAKL
ncbi:MAG: CoA-binding protein [Pseudomonadota bacterium]